MIEIITTCNQCNKTLLIENFDLKGFPNGGFLQIGLEAKVIEDPDRVEKEFGGMQSLNAPFEKHHFCDNICFLKWAKECIQDFTKINQPLKKKPKK